MASAKKQKIQTQQIEQSLHDKLYTKNEYGYEHQHGNYPTLSNEEKTYLRENGLNETFEYKTAEGPTKVPVHPMCISCQARHILKYKDHSNVKEGEKPFQVRCKGVPGEMPPGSNMIINKYVTEHNADIKRAKLLFKSTVDPVSWGELVFGFGDETKGTDDEMFFRWYQKEQIRCSAKRIVLREGRRSGKTFAMAVKLLYLALNTTVSGGRDGQGNLVQTGPQIIIITPFQAQLINVFNEMERLVKRNIDITADIKSNHGGSLYIKSPFFKMEFANGATISGFVTGVEIRQDGNAGGSLRGQSAHIIYVDEMDAIHEDILDKVIMPILFTHRDGMFFATSTPIGKAGKFHELCKNRPDFKEDYLPSTVLPHWEEVIKKEVEYQDPNDDAFIAEYMAEFVENSTGVFKSDYVYAAMYDYKYEDTDLRNAKWWMNIAKVGSRAHDLITVIGIDWNKNAGSEFVVICYNTRTDEWWVADAVNISPGQFNSIRFKDEVKRLNFKWQPNYVYADEGYGHHIIDDLMWESHQINILINNAKNVEALKGITHLDQATAKLQQRLKKFNFSQKVELSDPINGTPFERTGKEFLVENAVRVFESERIYFPSGDSTLKQQLLNYIVVRRHASNNRPVYGMRSAKVGDHRLDALMLALGGLFLEKHPIYSPAARLSKSIPVLLKKDQLESRHGHQEEGLPRIPGVHAEFLKIQRETVIPERDGSPQVISEASWAKPKTRGEFPSRKNMKSGSALEQLKNRASEYNGGRPNPQKSNGDSGGLFVTRKNKRSSRGSW